MAADHKPKNTSTIFNFFTCVILLLSIILMMINHCDGSSSLSSSSSSSSMKHADECNGTMGECPTSVEEYEEFLMDNEEHRMLMDQGKKYLTYDGLDKNSPVCNGNCEGLKNVKHRQCLTTYRCTG
ncbi:hypothetical protein R6Q59_005638 [Mikania micrantha]